MNKYMVLYLSSASAEDQMQSADPEAAKKAMDMWMAWFQKQGSAIVDGGEPLGKAMNFTEAGKSKGQSHVAGYSIVQTADMESVQKMLKEHPHFGAPGASIEVLEIMAIPT